MASGVWAAGWAAARAPWWVAVDRGLVVTEERTAAGSDVQDDAGGSEARRRRRRKRVDLGLGALVG
jgi:hypothetical protein